MSVLSIEESFIEKALEKKIINRQKVPFNANVYPQLSFQGGKKVFDFPTTEAFIESLMDRRSHRQKQIVIDSPNEYEIQRNNFAIRLFYIFFQRYCHTIAVNDSNTFIITPNMPVLDILNRTHLPFEAEFDYITILFLDAHLFNQKVSVSGIKHFFADPTYEKIRTTNFHLTSNDLFNLVEKVTQRIKISLFTTSSYRLLDSRILDRCSTLLFNLERNVLSISQRCMNSEIEESLFMTAEKLFFSGL